MRRLIPFLTLVALTAAISCSRRGYEVFEGYAQGGGYCVKANVGGVRAGHDEIAAGIDSILFSIDTTFSGYNSKSQLSRLNAGEAITPSQMFLDLLAISDTYKNMTGGAFDVCAAPLYDIWGFGFKSGELPDEGSVSAAMEECRKGKSMNFNAIAQGYTCDVIASYLHSLGVKDMLVDVGEIYCEGLNASGKGWSIGIDTPIDGNDTPGAQLSGIWTSDGGSYGVVTSGNYRKFYVRDGKKYAHIIDPRTGYPVRHNLLSATVIAPNATEADAMATYFMVTGFEQARDYVLEKESLEACLITSDTTWFSPGFRF